jgi:hypothetical protein
MLNFKIKNHPKNWFWIQLSVISYQLSVSQGVWRGMDFPFSPAPLLLCLPHLPVGERSRQPKVLGELYRSHKL